MVYLFLCFDSEVLTMVYPNMSVASNRIYCYLCNNIQRKRKKYLNVCNCSRFTTSRMLRIVCERHSLFGIQTPSVWSQYFETRLSSHFFEIIKITCFITRRKIPNTETETNKFCSVGTCQMRLEIDTHGIYVHTIQHIKLYMFMQCNC